MVAEQVLEPALGKVRDTREVLDRRRRGRRGAQMVQDRRDAVVVLGLRRHVDRQPAERIAPSLICLCTAGGLAERGTQLVREVVAERLGEQGILTVMQDAVAKLDG